MPAQLADVWQTEVGGRLSAPVVVGGTVLVSQVDAGQVVALEAASGKPRWIFVAGGRVDSPPTVWKGMALFGAADGYVYALRLTDGALAWRFRAAPQELCTVALDRVESVWPVHGSVLLVDGIAYVTAGRDSHLDGGIVMYAMDPMTGSVLKQSLVRSEHSRGIEGAKGGQGVQKIGQNATDNKTFAAPDKSDAFSMAGTRSDVLVSDGRDIYLHHLRFDRNCERRQQMGRHLFSTTSLLDDDEYHRSHWVLGTGDFSRLPVSYPWIARPGKSKRGIQLAVPFGLMLSFDSHTVWGISRERGYTLFAEVNHPFAADEPHQPDFRTPGTSDAVEQWSVRLAMRPRAMLQSGGALVVGGTPELTTGGDSSAYEGWGPGLLWTLSTGNGGILAQRKLSSPPVWDGMAVAEDSLFLATTDGSVLRLGRLQSSSFRQPPPSTPAVSKL